MNTVLKPYMVSDGCPVDGSVLVFAHTARKARVVGYPAVSNWCDDIEFINMRAVRMRGDHLYKDADQEKLKAGIPHSNDNPTGCKVCEMWGAAFDENGVCEDCRKGDTDGLD